jgi:hypothetical protein
MADSELLQLSRVKSMRALGAVLFALFLHGAAIGQQSEQFRIGFEAAAQITQVLAKAGVSASLQYNGKCSPPVLVPDLPPIRHLKAYPQSPADSFRSMFSVRPQMAVSQERNGTIRVVENGIQTDVLSISIRHLSFTGITDPDEALGQVLDAAEVQSFMQTRGIGQPRFMWSDVRWYELPGLKTSRAAGVPSSDELNDVTVADALDHILKLFPGFWLYQNCVSSDGQRIVYFGLFPVPGRMWGWEEGNTFVK